ncbi:MAG: cysteine desulfurase family protein [Candidatus ainarchaeum sp.]|nr:cysteine desulfurase family protein [Candidatus ainarchaeum sp.]
MAYAYLDNSATTMTDPEAVKAMLPYFTESYGNPSSLHSFGTEAREAVEKARAQVARLVGAKPGEIVFTSGGTESDNLALRGAAGAGKPGANRIVTSNVEHPAVLETCKSLEARGARTDYLRIDRDGFVSPVDAARIVSERTAIVSVMLANNEIGTIQPVQEVAVECRARARNALVHTDAVQAAGKIPVDVERLGVDLLSLASHKFHGPKGVGALFVREGVRLSPAMTGGGHEKGLRSGTENVPGIVGMGKAAEIARENLGEDAARMTRLRDRLIDGLLPVEETFLNGSREKRLPNNANLRFLGIEGESLVLLLDGEGVAASTGSACSSKKLQASHVLLALGIPEWQAHGSLRLTLSRFTTDEEVSRAVDATKGAVSRLRAMSPVWKKIKAGEPVIGVKGGGHEHV